MRSLIWTEYVRQESAQNPDKCHTMGATQHNPDFSAANQKENVFEKFVRQKDFQDKG